MLDGVCLESGISESELEQGKLYFLPDGRTLIVKFLGNNVAVWVDEELVPINHKEKRHQVNPLENITFVMLFMGGWAILLGILQFLPLSDVDSLSSTFLLNPEILIFLGTMLLICGYAGRYHRKPWALWLGDGFLLVLLIMWCYDVFIIDWVSFRITRIFYAALFLILYVEQVKNTKKALASLKQKQ